MRPDEPSDTRATVPPVPSTAGEATPAAADAAQPPGPALELLVHGVGGASPEEVLDDPRTVRVTGDRTAAIYRRADDVDAEERPPASGRPAEEPVREAYCWAGLTSGNGARALWLVLLPFMVVNLAHWMRPAAPGRHRARRLYDIAVRLVALSLTVLFTAAACEVALDLVAWQCADSAGCTADRSWLTFVSPDEGGWWATPGRRLVLAALLPAGLVVGLWWLSHRTWSAYESASPPPRPPGRPAGTQGAQRPVLSLPGFWYGRRLVARLRAAHTAAGLLTVACALLAAAAAHDRGPAGGGALEACGWALAAAAGVGWAAVLWVVTRRGRTEAELDEQRDRAVSRALPVFAGMVLLLAGLHAGWARPGWEATDRLPGTGLFPVLVVTQGVLVAVVALLALRLHRAAASAGHRTVMGGMGGAAVALLSCALGGVLTGGVAQRASEWLVTGSTTGEPGRALPGPPVLLTWQAAVIPALLVTLTVPVAIAVVRVLRDRARLAPGILARYEGESRPLPSRSRRIAGAIARARLTDMAPLLVSWISGLTLLLGAGAVAGAVLTGTVPARAAQGAAGPLPALAEIAQAMGSWLMGAGVVLLLALGRLAYRDAGARRTVGILWDVGTFWPRAAHPFAPPCYAERAVPDLTWRMATWTECTGGRLVISGHSQGSVLAAAAVLQLDTATRSRVALLTYGSPLERLYGRWFPAYFGPAALRGLRRGVAAWRNLWRDTDPIGGPVEPAAGRGADAAADAEPASPPVDRGPLKDPLTYGRTLRDPLPAPILGHGDYQADPVFAEERSALLARLAWRDGTPPGGPSSPAPGVGRQPTEAAPPARDTGA